MNVNDNEIGKLIKRKRKERKLTLEDVAKHVGVGKSTVSKWERGAILNIKRDKLDALSLILGIDPLIFIFGVDAVNNGDIEFERISAKEFATEVKQLLNKTENLTEQQKQHLLSTLDFICSTSDEK